MSELVGHGRISWKASFDELLNEGDEIRPIVVELGNDRVRGHLYVPNFGPAYFLDIILPKPARKRYGHCGGEIFAFLVVRTTCVGAQVENDIEKGF